MRKRFEGLFLFAWGLRRRPFAKLVVALEVFIVFDADDVKLFLFCLNNRFLRLDLELGRAQSFLNFGGHGLLLVKLGFVFEVLTFLLAMSLLNGGLY